MINKQTTLDLNGPILSFVQQPTSVSICYAGIATFVGIATATFPTQTPSNSATPTGSISYQWYDQNGQLIDNEIVTGSGTTTLELYNNSTNRQVFLRADYTPSAYGQDPITVITARSTPNAINDTLDSSIATLSVYPSISITSSPTDITVAQKNTADFSVQASASDGSNVSYQWQLNGIDLADGTNTNSSFTPSPTVKTLTITDDLSVSTTVDFTKLSTYSNFITGRTYTITANANIVTKIYAVGGGGGGASAAFSATGGSGGAAQGTFAFEKGKTYKLIVGGGANRAYGGYGGGGSGLVLPGGILGAGGGGGGYTGLFLNSISQTNAILIAGGGGGGSYYGGPHYGGAGGGLTGGNGSRLGASGGGGTQSSGGFSVFNPGGALQGGSGPSGGGGGYFGGGAGYSFTFNNDGPGGGGSGYINSTSITNGSFDATNSAGGGGPQTNGSFKIDLVSTSISTVITASGTKTPTLKISSNTIGLNQIRCKVTHPTSCSSPIYTNSVNFTVVDARQIITFEKHFSSTATIESINLFNGDYTLLPSSASTLMTFYAPEKDINIEMDIYSAAGGDNGSFKGGEGGFSRVRFRMPQNVEYTIAGFNFGVNPYIYKQSRMLIVVGSGGWAGPLGNGGPGGGVGVGGGNGSGREGGKGGSLVLPGELGQDGRFGSTTFEFPIGFGGDLRSSGGIATGCPPGDYWNKVGISACQNMGNIQFRLANGSVVSNSAVISRGFKAGYGVRQTAGFGRNGAIGGTGATGGNGGDGGSGGGGGSGYHDGSIEVVKTTLGGNLEKSAKIIVRAIN